MRTARRNRRAHLRPLTRTIPLDSHGYPLDIMAHPQGGCHCYYDGGTPSKSMRVRYNNNCPARHLPNTAWPKMPPVSSFDDEDSPD